MVKKPPPEPSKLTALRAQIAERVQRLDQLDTQIGAAIQRAADIMKGAKPGCRVAVVSILNLGSVAWGKCNGAWQFVWLPSTDGEEMPLLSAPRHVRLAFAPKLDEETLLTRTLQTLDDEIKQREEIVR